MCRLGKIMAALLAVGVVLGGGCYVVAAGGVPPSAVLETVLADTGAYLLETVQSPRDSSISGEWAIIGLARSGCPVPPDWYATYYRALEKEVVQKQGVLHDKKYTEYSRVVLALAAIGKNPADVGGYNLPARLDDLDLLFGQGVNGPIYALLALDALPPAVLDSAGARVKTVHKLLPAAIAGRQLPGGGFSLGGQAGDADVTAMALQALAPYREYAGIQPVIAGALACLSRLQQEDGGYTCCWGQPNVESAAQVLVALTALGIDPLGDKRFVKQGSTVVDYLLSFSLPGGGFKHSPDQLEADGMATVQAFYGLVAYDRFLRGKSSFYDLRDLPLIAAEPGPGAAGLPGKDPRVLARPVCSPGKTFTDVPGGETQTAILALASRGIISGVGAASFVPDRTMTRAEFAAIVVRALGLAPAGGAVFDDVAAASWYATYVNTACASGIARGTAENLFSPEDTISREQAAVMIARAARLCGLDTAMTAAEIQDCLAPFPDYSAGSDWAREALAFCAEQAIYPAPGLRLEPQKAATRAEIALMVHRLLKAAALL